MKFDMTALKKGFVLFTQVLEVESETLDRDAVKNLLPQLAREKFLSMLNVWENRTDITGRDFPNKQAPNMLTAMYLPREHKIYVATSVKFTQLKQDESHIMDVMIGKY